MISLAIIPSANLRSPYQFLRIPASPKNLGAIEDPNLNSVANAHPQSNFLLCSNRQKLAG